MKKISIYILILFSSFSCKEFDVGDNEYDPFFLKEDTIKLDYPPNGELIDTNSIIFKWNPNKKTNNYILELSFNDKSFSNSIQYSTSNTFFQVDNLKEADTCYWRVKGIFDDVKWYDLDKEKESLDSTNFFIRKLNIVNITKPIKNLISTQIGDEINIEIDWENVNNADKYILKLEYFDSICFIYDNWEYTSIFEKDNTFESLDSILKKKAKEFNDGLYKISIYAVNDKLSIESDISKVSFLRAKLNKIRHIAPISGKTYGDPVKIQWVVEGCEKDIEKMTLNVRCENGYVYDKFKPIRKDDTFFVYKPIAPPCDQRTGIIYWNVEADINISILMISGESSFNINTK